MGEVLVETCSLVKHFRSRRGYIGRPNRTIKAVDGVDITVMKGESVGLVGESGCGKSTVGRCILNLLEPTSGHVLYDPPPDVSTRIEELRAEVLTHDHGDGTDNIDRSAELDDIYERYSLDMMSEGSLREVRKKIQWVPQDAFSALDPRMRVMSALEEPLIVHKIGGKDERTGKVTEMLRTVGLDDTFMERFPHEMSGGQRQRVCLARALMLRPELMVLDEPTSSLDVSVQAQVLNLLDKVRSERSMSFLFISHDLSVIDHMCDKVVVMFMGKVVETAPRKELFLSPMHPYTKELIGSIPVLDPRARARKVRMIRDMPDRVRTNDGCRFCERCSDQREICHVKEPMLSAVGGDHMVACHLYR